MKSKLAPLLMIMALFIAACGDQGVAGTTTTQETSEATTGDTTPVDETTTAESPDNECVGRSLNRIEPPGVLRDVDWTHQVGTPTWYTDVTLTSDQIEEVCRMELTGVFTNVVSGEGIQPYRDGIAAAFEDVGIELVAEAYAEFDAAKQAADVETAMALDPDIWLGLPVDPVSGAEAYRQIVEAGKCLVLGGVEPEGFQVGEDYYAQVTFDLPGLGIAGAEALAAAIGGSGKVGFMVHDADFFITNTRDQAALEHLADNYPDIDVVTAPMADPATAEEIANAMVARDPEIGVIYAPWSSGPAPGILAALSALGREDIKVVSNDLDPVMALSMAQGGPVYQVVGSMTYEFGYTWAVAGMQCILGLPTPTVAILPAITTSVDNLEEGWLLSFGPHVPFPEEVAEVLGG